MQTHVTLDREVVENIKAHFILHDRLAALLQHADPPEGVDATFRNASLPPLKDLDQAALGHQHMATIGQAIVYAVCRGLHNEQSLNGEVTLKLSD